MQSEFASRLLAWFDRHGRKDLPWQCDDPYRIWISEIMLQQTQVQTVIPYYERFVLRFPNVESLAAATADEVLHHWSGLGYYARARNLHKAAKTIRNEYGGTFPSELEAVQALPGIGPSTAAAILALAFGQHHAILDGNVKRVLARHALVDGWPGTTSVAKRLWALAGKYTPAERVGDYTQAIMDLGATLCTRSKPKCELCPVSEDCTAFAEGSMGDYPGRRPKRVKPLKQTTMLIAVSERSVYLERRPEAGIWGGLWSLPELAPAQDEPSVDAWCRNLAGATADRYERWELLRHSFSHYDLDIEPVVVRLSASDGAVADRDDALWYRLDDTPPGGLAAPVKKLLETLRMSDHVPNR